ncbi:AAA family ATPase [Leisingera caerulea]|uniref:AAA family ATPase n=1 Tax=Leisingera caerulea TaxID=506591 RepID=UPI0004203C27|nr:AAA family ATPase [Leisingera caerulea]
MDGQAVPREHQLNGAALDFYFACKSLIDRGFYVLPCRKDKRPATAHGFKDATQDLHQVYTWAQGIPDAQPAVACAKSGLVVIDIDNAEAFDTFLGVHGLKLPNTLCARTAGGGRHLYFRAPQGLRFPGELCKGVEIKYNGYVLAPPAEAYSKRTACFGAYSWEDLEQTIAPMPDWPKLSSAAQPAEAALAPQGERSCPNERKTTSLAELAELLFHVPADIEYIDWLRMLGAVYTATSGSSDGLALADQWSSGGTKYKPGEVDQIWKTLSVDKSSGAPCIAVLAQQNGANLSAIGGKYRTSEALGEIDVSGLLKSQPVTACTTPAALHSPSAAATEAEERIRQRAQVLRSSTIAGDQAKAILDQDYLIKGWLGRAEFSMLYGPSNAGKTFVALNIANHVARNLEWNGQRVRGGPVVYFAAEGGRSLGNRLVALPGGASANLHLVPEPIDLYSDELDVHAIVQLAKDILGDGENPALIVIDTLARSIGGADENTGTDVGLLINRVDYIRRATGANVMLVHHTGKDIERGARGHSSLRAAVDTEIFCGKKDGQRYIEATKQRNVETGAQLPFQLEPHFLGLDTDGDKKTTCYVKFLAPSAWTAAKKGAGGNQRKVLDLFQQYLNNCIADGTAKAPDEAAPSSVDQEGFRTFAVPKMGKGDDKKNRRAFDDALRALTGDGALVPDGASLALQY